MKCDFCGSTTQSLFSSSYGGYICGACLKEGKDPDTYRNHETNSLKRITKEE